MIGAALLLAIWSGLFLWRARQNPYLLVGWFWFLGTLIPAIGLVQVGSQSMADRYTVSSQHRLVHSGGVGLERFFELASPLAAKVAMLAGAAGAGGLSVGTGIQLGYWQNSIKLLRHTIAVTTDNYCLQLSGRALDDAGKRMKP